MGQLRPPDRLHSPTEFGRRRSAGGPNGKRRNARALRVLRWS